MPRPRCPSCGKAVAHTDTQYGPRWSCCGLWSWSRDRPLVDRRTHNARQAAHKAFDELWRGPDAFLRRGAAYALLQQALGLTPDQCHMALMDVDTAERVPAAVQSIWEQHHRNPA